MNHIIHVDASTSSFCFQIPNKSSRILFSVYWRIFIEDGSCPDLIYSCFFSRRNLLRKLVTNARCFSLIVWTVFLTESLESSIRDRVPSMAVSKASLSCFRSFPSGPRRVFRVSSTVFLIPSLTVLWVLMTSSVAWKMVSMMLSLNFLSVSTSRSMMFIFLGCSVWALATTSETRRTAARSLKFMLIWIRC